MPSSPNSTRWPADALRLALTDLAANIGSGRTRHDCDVLFGHAVAQVLTPAQSQIDAIDSVATAIAGTST
jgi:citrate lyase beta subunit